MDLATEKARNHAYLMQLDVQNKPMRRKMHAQRTELNRLNATVRGERKAHHAAAAERDATNDEIARFHRLLLDRTGATQIEPVDAIMGRWLDQLAELEQHHREHHNCSECVPCLAHRGPAT